MSEAVREEIRIDSLITPLSHYTDVVKIGDLVFLSGAGPVDGDGNLVGGDDIVEQTRQVLRNMEAMLEASGATFADIAKVTCYVTDISELKAIDTARREFFGEAKPTSTLIGVRELGVPGMRIEIEAIAVVGSGQRRREVVV